jgi:cation:H+ antiporter
MLAVAVFVVGSAVSLGTSWVLVSRIERLGGRLRMPEALLGVVAALAADAPEVTAAVSAMISHDQRVGAGVVLGSNVFNLAALLGLSAVVAGRIGLHRSVVLLSGAVAVWVAVVSACVVAGWLPAAAGLVLASAGVALYVILIATRGNGLPGARMPRRWAWWVAAAVRDEELELEGLILPARGRSPDWAIAGAALAVVAVASVVMERAAVAAGQRYAVPEIVIGGLVLAAVTSLPNAVAAVYLARRGRGAATLSTALNSNALNVVFGLLLPATLTGLGAVTAQAGLVTGWYLTLTAASIMLAARYSGLGRMAGGLIIGGYAVFACSLLASGYRLASGPLLRIVLAVTIAVLLACAAWPDLLARARSAAWTARRAWAGRLRSLARMRELLESRAALLPDWSVGRLWAFSLLLSALAAGIDGAAGHVVLVGLVIAGPCCVLLTGRWAPTALTGTWAIGLAVILGIPDGIWATSTHLAFITAVTSVAATTTVAAAVISHHAR